MAGNQDNHRVAGRYRLGPIVVFLLTPGCCEIAPDLCPIQPDLAAIIKVVNDVYRTQGLERPVLFLDTGEACASTMPQCVAPDGGIFPALKTQLETDLQVKVRPLSEADLGDLSVPALTPVLPETGEVGVSVTLGRFSVDEEGLLRVTASIVRSGLDMAFSEFVLGPGEDGWAINDVTHKSLDEQIRAADLALAVEGHPNFGPTRALLDLVAGDTESTFYVLERMKTWVSCRWRIAAAINPDFVDEICDRMVDVAGDQILPHEFEACRNGETCLLR